MRNNIILKIVKDILLGAAKVFIYLGIVVMFVFAVDFAIDAIGFLYPFTVIALSILGKILLPIIGLCILYVFIAGPVSAIGEKLGLDESTTKILVVVVFILVLLWIAFHEPRHVEELPIGIRNWEYPPENWN